MAKTFLILEIDDKLIKVCQVDRSRKKTIISHISAVEFPQKAADKEIEEFLAKLPKQACDKVLISFSRTFFLIRFLDLPSQSREEISRMLPFQLAKVVPYPLNVVVYDFSVLEVKEGVSKVVVFLIQEKKAAHFLEVINKSGITPQIVTISSWGVYNWFNHEKSYFEEKINWPVVLVDIDKYSAELLAVNENNILFSRAFYYSDDESLFEGVNQSLDIFEKTFGGHEFGRVIFTGNKKEIILDKFSVQNSIFISQGEKFFIENEAADYLKESNFSFASIMGLSAVKDKDLLKFDFSPAYLKGKRQFSLDKQKYLKTAVLLLEVILICGLLFFRVIFDKYAYLKFLNSKLKEVKPRAEELNKIKRQLKIIEKFNKDTYFSDVIEGVMSFLPQGVQLTLLDFQENGYFSMKGYARDYSSVSDIKSALSKLDFLKDVKVNYVAKTKQQNMDMVEFYIYGERKIFSK